MQKITLIGDIALTGLFVKSKVNNFNRFKEVIELFNNSTFAIANLEVPIKGNNDDLNPNKNIHFYTESEIVKEIFPLLKIKIVSLANNHIGDYGISGVQSTIDVLDELKILHTGAGTKTEHIEPLIFELNRKKIAFLAYVDKSTNPKTEFFPELLINYFEPDKVIDDIKSIRDKVDKIICSIHWGMDYSRYFTNQQQALARKLIDVEADVIMGHHSHTYQPYEFYRNSLIFYSLGQLCFGDMIWEGKLRSLKRKTKVSYIPVLNEEFKIERFIKTKELKGNNIKIYLNSKFERYNQWIYRLNIIKNKNVFINFLINTKENILDRFIEYFFGYYRNPFKQIISIFSNIYKLKFIKRDFKKAYRWK